MNRLMTGTALLLILGAAPLTPAELGGAPRTFAASKRGPRRPAPPPPPKPPIDPQRPSALAPARPAYLAA
jgi:hypothetical protein